MKHFKIKYAAVDSETKLQESGPNEVSTTKVYPLRCLSLTKPGDVGRIVPAQKYDSTVDVNRWTAALQREDILQDDYDRMIPVLFYFIVFCAESERNIMGYAHFENLIGCSMRGYLGSPNFGMCIHAFRNKIRE